MVYDLPILGVVCSKSRFSRQLVNCQFDWCFVLHAGLIGIRNQKSRPPMDLFQLYEHNGGLRISKRVSVRNHISRGKLNSLELREIFNNLWSRASFWKLSIPLDSCWRVEYNFEVKSLFWLTDKILTFWTILPLGSEIGNWSSEADMNARRAPLGSYKR